MSATLAMTAPGQPTVPLSETRGYIGSFMPKGLFDKVSNSLPTTSGKHVFFDQIIREYVEAWSSGRVPRVYMGQGVRGLAEQKTLYMDNVTIEAIKEIAEIDGVAVSHIVRTAFAWHVAGRKKCADIFAGDEVLGDRPNIKVKTSTAKSA